MLYSTEYLVYLLMLPVTVFIILPLMIFLAWMTVLGLKELFALPMTQTDAVASKKNNDEDALQPSEA